MSCCWGTGGFPGVQHYVGGGERVLRSPEGCTIVYLESKPEKGAMHGLPAPNTSWSCFHTTFSKTLSS